MDTPVRYVIQTRRLAEAGNRMESQAGRDSRVGTGHLEEMEGAQMNDEARQNEQERRELAQQHAGEVVEGSGRVVTPRRLGQMVSVRLDPGLVEALRELANRRGISLSDVLRDAAIRLLEAEEAASRTTTSWRIVSQPMVPTPGITSENASAAS
jgi:hypothetical protein